MQAPLLLQTSPCAAQLTHGAPPVPQARLEGEVHMPPWQHPDGQVAGLHVVALMQEPFAHVSPMAAQLTQAPPFNPHAESLAGWHVPLEQQPAHVLGQVPPQPSLPPPHGLPAQLGVQTHW